MRSESNLVNTYRAEGGGGPDCRVVRGGDDHFYMLMRHGLETFVFSKMSSSALGFTQPPIQWILRTHSLGVTQPGRENECLPPSIAEIKNGWSYNLTSFIFLLSVQRGQFTCFIFYIKLYNILKLYI